MTSLILPPLLSQIEGSTFANCLDLEEIVIPEGVIFIREMAFSNCEALNNLVLPTSLRKVENRAFSNCANLKNLSILEGVQKIESSAFLSCAKLISIAFPASIRQLGSLLFDNCVDLGRIHFSGPAPRVDGGRFVTDSNQEIEARVLPVHLDSFGMVDGLWNGLRLQIGIAMEIFPILIHEISRKSDGIELRFSGEAGITDWRVNTTTNLSEFTQDLTNLTTFQEIEDGIYEATIDIAETPPFSPFLPLRSSPNAPSKPSRQKQFPSSPPPGRARGKSSMKLP